jgi:hypothetical protein
MFPTQRGGQENLSGIRRGSCVPRDGCARTLSGRAWAPPQLRPCSAGWRSAGYSSGGPRSFRRDCTARSLTALAKKMVRQASRGNCRVSHRVMSLSPLSSRRPGG